MGDGLEGEGLEGVAGEDGDGFSENLMTRRASATQVVIIERGQIVVDERVGVNQLERAGGRKGQIESGPSAP